MGSLGHHWGSWVGEAIQSGWGLLDGEGRLLELSLPLSFAGERGTPSPVNQNPGSETPCGVKSTHGASPTYTKNAGGQEVAVCHCTWEAPGMNSASLQRGSQWQGQAPISENNARPTQRAGPHAESST